MSMAGLILAPEHRLSLNREWKELREGEPLLSGRFSVDDRLCE